MSTKAEDSGWCSKMTSITRRPDHWIYEQFVIFAFCLVLFLKFSFDSLRLSAVLLIVSNFSNRESINTNPVLIHQVLSYVWCITRKQNTLQKVISLTCASQIIT